MVIPILSIIGLTCQYSRIFNVDFTKSIPVVLSSLIIFLYGFAIFDLLYVATNIAYIFGIGCVFFNAVFYRKDWITRTNEYFTEALIILSLVVAYGYYTRNAVFASWDDLAFWGIFTKELLINHLFESADIVTSLLKTHAHYPRGPSIYHYFMMLPTGFSEGKALVSHFIIHLVFLAPLMGNKKYWHSLALVIPVIAIVAMYTTGMRSIYNDSTVGLIFCSIFSIYILEINKNKALLICLPLFALLPIYREIGFLLSIIAAIILLLDSVRKDGIKKTTILYLLPFVLPVITSNIWSTYFKSTHDFFGRNEHSFSNLLKLYNDFDNQGKLLIFNYVKSIGGFLIKEGSMLTYMIIVIAVYLVLKSKDKEQKADFKFFNFAAIFGFFIFVLWRLYLYFYTYSYVEAVRAASLLRYLGCYFLVFSVISLTYLKIILNEAKQQDFKKSKIILAGILLLCAAISLTQIARVKTTLTNDDAKFMEFAKKIAQLKNHNIEVEFDFSSKKDPMECYNLNYNLVPHYMGWNNMVKCLEKNINDESISVDKASDLDEVDACIKDKSCKVKYYPFVPAIVINKASKSFGHAELDSASNTSNSYNFK